jgi:hypothetical protein
MNFLSFRIGYVRAGAKKVFFCVGAHKKHVRARGNLYDLMIETNRQIL